MITIPEILEQLKDWPSKDREALIQQIFAMNEEEKKEEIRQAWKEVRQAINRFTSITNADIIADSNITNAYGEFIQFAVTAEEEEGKITLSEY